MEEDPDEGHQSRRNEEGRRVPEVIRDEPAEGAAAQEPGVQARDERGEVPGPVLGRGVRHDEDLPGEVDEAVAEPRAASGEDVGEGIRDKAACDVAERHQQRPP